MREPHSVKEKVFFVIRDMRTFLAVLAVRGEKDAQTKLSEAELHTRRFLEEQQDFKCLRRNLSWTCKN